MEDENPPNPWLSLYLKLTGFYYHYYVRSTQRVETAYYYSTTYYTFVRNNHNVRASHLVAFVCIYTYTEKDGVCYRTAKVAAKAS